MPRRRARLLCVLGSLVLLAALAGSPWISRVGPEQVIATPRPPLARAVASALLTREAAVQQLLDTRARALAQHDRSAWLSTVEPGAAAFRRQQGALFDALAHLPLLDWSSRLERAQPSRPSSLLDARRGAGWWAPAVRTAYRLAGWDSHPVTRTTTPTFVPRGGRWYLAAEADLPATDVAELWDQGPVVSLRRGPVLVLAHPGSARLLAAVAAAAAEAVPRVTSVWGPDWAQRVVVLIPSSSAELAALTGLRTDTSQIAAYAASRAPGVGERVIVNPATFPLLGSLGRRVVLTHEITHVAARAATGPAAPLWLVEGFADYVGYRGLSLPLAVSAQELRADVRAGRVPDHLPSTSDFDGSNPHLAAAYEQAWLAVSLLARRAGQPALLRFYRAVGAGRSAEAALRDLTGSGLAPFTRTWQADLRSRLS